MPTKERPPLVGSQHVYSAGYGYGMRYPTERNHMTLPASVPQFRYPPDTERFISGMHSSHAIKKDSQSMKRNAEQIIHQTSGEIGFHTLGYDSQLVQLNSQPLRPHPKVYHSPIPHTFSVDHFTGTATSSNNNSSKSKSLSDNNNSSSIGNDNVNTFVNTSSGRRPWTQSSSNSARSQTTQNRPNSSRWDEGNSGRDDSFFSRPNTQRDQWSSSGCTHPNNSGSDGHAARGNDKYLETLRTLDSSFGRRARNDLFTASLPPKPQQEMMWLATANNRAAMQSKAWQGKLRKDA